MKPSLRICPCCERALKAPPTTERHSKRIGWAGTPEVTAGIFMNIGEPVLIDTNLLVFALDEESPCHKKAVDLQRQVVDGQIDGCLAPQNLYEFFATVTDSRRIPRPLSPSAALDVMDWYMKAPAFRKIYPLRETTVHRLMQLVRHASTKRGDIFDASLVAVMLENHVTTILTDNEKDFEPFAGIKAFNPVR